MPFEQDRLQTPIFCLIAEVCSLVSKYDQLNVNDSKLLYVFLNHYKVQLPKIERFRFIIKNTEIQMPDHSN